MYMGSMARLADISIHAPGKGATVKSFMSGKDIKFQSTLPGRERRPAPSARFIPPLFQSTLPGRERRLGGCCPYRWGISIHAPGKGATGRLDENG